MNTQRVVLALPFLAMLVQPKPVWAVPITENLDVGGAIRGRLDIDPDRDISKFDFDTLILRADYNSEQWIGSAQYRLYGNAYPYRYTDDIGDIAFFEHAWIGYKFSPAHQLQVGQTDIPFGLGGYFGNTFFETLGNVIGLEDTQDLGIKYVGKFDLWDFSAAYYPVSAQQGRGTSRGGRTYGTSVASADDYVAQGSDNEERDILVGRLARHYSAGEWQGEVGLSLLSSTLHNNDTNRDGQRLAAALHLKSQHGPLGFQTMAARQQMTPKNPEADTLVSFGGFDATFNVAAKGNLYVADVSYELAPHFGWLSKVKIYGNYSLFDKDQKHFKDSQRAILGTSFNLGPVWVAMEWLHGRNDPYIGGSDFTQSLAAGGSNRWENQIYGNIGYYF
ncbi:hypothetical protein ACIPZ8_15185 [Pseudomonas sp. NPDC089422]|uniref:hypothetical protein n=1 Tax=Pseudomonas sp. NPDC089422 TaxID=3364466 RepID=UPI0038284E59